MTDKMTTYPLKKMATGVFYLKLIFVSFLTINLSLSPSVLAQPADTLAQQWWFDVEVILFERNLDAVNISEKFKQSQFEQSTNDYLDLLTPYLTPDLSYLRAGLPYCRASNRQAVKKQYEQGFALPLSVVKTNESSLQQEQQLAHRQQQTHQVLTVRPDDLSAVDFENKVSTTSILAHSKDNISLAQTAAPKDVISSNLRQVNSGNLEQQTHTAQAPKISLISPPINVEFIEWQIPSELLCAYAEQIDPSLASLDLLHNDAPNPQPKNNMMRVPEIINGIEWQQKRSAFLLPTSNMQMSDLYQKIKKQRDITPLLHINWRQEVKFGRDNGQAFRLFAGDNFVAEFDANGLPLIGDPNNLFDSLNQPADEFYMPKEELAQLTPQQQQSLLAGINGAGSEAVTENLFARITNALADNTPFSIDQINQTEHKTIQHIDNNVAAIPKDLWKLDGTINVYLRNVGRVPYLHIDSNLDFRLPVINQIKEQQPGDLSTNSANQQTIMQDVIVDQIQAPNFLQRANFNQLRRVISRQVHYFDHPLFGMVVSINRYRWPEVPVDDVTSVSQDN